MGQEMGTQRLECLAPVADRGFVRRAQLGQRPAERRIKEDGIVAEPLIPTWGGEDLAANDPLGFEAKIDLDDGLLQMIDALAPDR